MNLRARIVETIRKMVGAEFAIAYSAHQRFIKEGNMRCASCNHNSVQLSIDEMVAGSPYPLRYRCKLTGRLHNGSHECDCLVRGKIRQTEARTAHLVDVSKESIKEIADAVADKVAAKSSKDSIDVVRCENCEFFYLDDSKNNVGRCKFHCDNCGKMEKVNGYFFCAYGLSLKK